MPCFLKDHNQAYEEGVIVGRLFAGYGELEMAVCARIIEETRGRDFDTPVGACCSIPKRKPSDGACGCAGRHGLVQAEP